MTAVRSRNFSLEEVLTHDIFNDSTTVNVSERPPNCFWKLKEALGDLAREKGFEDVAFFVHACTKQVEAVLTSSASNGNVLATLSSPINLAPILQREARLWLAGIWRRIGGRRSVRNPSYGEIHRDTPLEIFLVIVRVVRGLDGFVEPCCFHCDNSKAIVLSFTSMRLVHELFDLLSGFSNEVVAGYFNRVFSGVRKGHTTAVIVNEVKNFALIYKKRS